MKSPDPKSTCLKQVNIISFLTLLWTHLVYVFKKQCHIVTSNGISRLVNRLNYFVDPFAIHPVDLFLRYLLKTF